MGQQQLLLIILVTIIVGIATVVAINTFSSAADSANVDAARQDGLSIAAAAQQYYMKPTALGGGNHTFDNMDFTKISGVAIKTASTKTQAYNDNGSYKIAPNGSQFTLTVYPSSCYASGNTTTDYHTCDNSSDALTATVRANSISWSN